MDKRESEKRGAVGGSPKPAARVDARGSAAAPVRERSAVAEKDDDLETLAVICANDWDEV